MTHGKNASRLDLALVARGVFPTRARAQAAVLAGEVFVNGERVTKAGAPVGPGATVEVRAARPEFASRGGIKLDHALTAFALDVRGLRAVDVGSSTGGFTDCLLRRGAAHVYAVDVGTGQLAWRLRTDPRVTVLERRDVRSVAAEELGGPVDVVTADVSFIGLGKVIGALRDLARPGGVIVVLVKPQFEAGPKAARRGVVRDAAVHEEVVRKVIGQAEEAGLSAIDATYSPIAGPEGNLEYFLRLETAPGRSHPVDVAAVVRTAHERVARRGLRPRAGRPS
jgi:23S rRNA (cytidine1920-2'-O)/16S rRNA (cytidine1409-2'-O)-methyltransferase